MMARSPLYRRRLNRCYKRVKFTLMWCLRGVAMRQRRCERAGRVFSSLRAGQVSRNAIFLQARGYAVPSVQPRSGRSNYSTGGIATSAHWRQISDYWESDGAITKTFGITKESATPFGMLCELCGELHGLLRVYALSDDAHCCRSR